jgi:hydrogenase maturation protease
MSDLRSYSGSCSGNEGGRILVLGIGNLLRKDDGFGIHVLDRLQSAELPRQVLLLDGGTAGIDLVTYLEDIDRLIIVDAVIADGNPGEIRILSGEDIAGSHFFIPGHYGRLVDILDMAGALWKRPDTVVVGVIPKDCESYEIGLSHEVSGAIDEVVRIITRMTLQGVGGAV